VERQGLYSDSEIIAAMDWLSDASGNATEFRARITRAQDLYREYVTKEEHLGKDPRLEALGPDRVASYLAQADSLVRDRGAYDLALGPRIVPFVKHIGSAVESLRQVNGSSKRATRMLRQESVDPESAIFELAVASAYLRAGFRLEFIEEAPPEKRPDFRILSAGDPIDIECKRLTQSTYAREESRHQGRMCEKLSGLVHERHLSIYIDVLYTQELSEIPEDYLLNHVAASLSSRIITRNGYPWKDALGEGTVRPAHLAAVHRDTAQSSLYFGTKLARLLSGIEVTQDAYNLIGSGEPDSRDPRYLDRLYYCSVINWGCSAAQSIDARARFVRSKLAEVDLQMHKSDEGIVHVGMDAQRDVHTSDIRRARNIEVVSDFQALNPLREIYLHYFVPLTTEVTAWSIDETTDCFGIAPSRKGLDRIFDQADLAENNLAAWYQPRPTSIV
jgi:hypothetical protein